MRRNQTGASGSDDATLIGLSSSMGTLEPVFNSLDTVYSLNLPAGVSSLNLSATPADGNAIVQGAGIIDVTAGFATVSVVVTAEDGSTTRTYTIQITVSASASDSFSSAGIKMYPNPTNTKLLLNGVDFRSTISLVDNAGKVWIKQEAKEDHINLDISGLEKGFYLVKIENGRRSYVSRLIISQ
jgi:hypothetical protein